MQTLVVVVVYAARMLDSSCWMASAWAVSRSFSLAGTSVCMRARSPRM